MFILVQSLCTNKKYMATNLHAMLRYQVIDRCCRDRDHHYHWPDIIELCNKDIFEKTGRKADIKRRTIMLDIKNMRSGKLGYEAPIEHDRQEGYYYSNPKFSIANVPLSKSDMEELRNALLLLKQFSGNEQIIEIENIITKLEETLNIKQSRKRNYHIQFEHSLNEKGQQWLSQIYEAVKNEQTLFIEYQPFQKEKTGATVSPYILKEYNNRWFLVGFNHTFEDISNFGLDRISSIRESLSPFYAKSGFNKESYFNEIIGVSYPEKARKTKIKFKAFGKQADYIDTKPIHSSQKLIKAQKEHSVFQIEVVPNFELYSKMLQFGARIEVIGPKKVRKEMMERVNGLRKLYKE